VLSPPKSVQFSKLNDLLKDPSINFVLLSCAETQAKALMSLPSPPSRILSYGYHLGVENYFNDKAL